MKRHSYHNWSRGMDQLWNQQPLC